MPLYEQLLSSIQLGENQKAELARSIEDGHAFFTKFNEGRMNLAFSSFSEDMKKALFEVIYFLHVNDPKYEYHLFPAKRIEKLHGVKKEVPYEESTCLFVPEAPAGVVGIENLSPQFKEEFTAFIEQELGGQITPAEGFAPIYSISSLGSIGTVGHKKTASDLDLQVQYELSPFLLQASSLTDQHISHYSKGLIKFFAKKYAAQKKYTAQDLKDRIINAEVLKAGKVNFHKRFPLLFAGVVLQKKDVLRNIFRRPEQKQALAHEVMDVAKLYFKIFLRKQVLAKEKLLNDKINRIQSYVQKKYPEAEVYLFAYSNDDYRDGKHGTTLDSKEASGSAYELILNYETLMPGIQFTPMIPIHFLMPFSVNNKRQKYERMIDYIRYNFTNQFDKYRERLVDLGATPPLTQEYMVAHSGAIYWESFKASSGNLPKAMLNLLRIEMLFDPRFNTSIIELIKNPKKLDDLIEDKTQKVEDEDDYDDDDYDDDDYDDDEEDDYDDDDDDFFDNFGAEEESGAEAAENDVLGEDDSVGSVTLQVLFSLEDKFPLLLADPWWLRYKALKIAFGPACRVIKDPDEIALVSQIIDLGFALHIRVADVFNKPGANKKYTTHREQFMVDFLAKAFPPSRRQRLEHIFIGEINAVLQFEKDLKFLFQRSMERVRTLVDVLPGKDESNQDEFKIWYYYYEKHFDPPENVVRRDILSHLKQARGRLQIGYRDKKWFFKSLQKRVLEKSRYDTFGNLDHLPDEVELFDHKSFLHGIAHCIQNNYYGITGRGTLLESRTHLEFSVAHMKMGKLSADKYAFIRPDSVVRLFDKIDRAFPSQDYDYRDCIYKEREITNIFMCLNLLEYGRLSILYRDNMKTWFVDLFDHPEIEKRAFDYYEESEKMLNSPFLHQTLKQFFQKQKFRLNPQTKSTVYYWVNPNSIHTHHPPNKVTLKEKELAKEFENVVFGRHGNG